MTTERCALAAALVSAAAATGLLLSAQAPRTPQQRMDDVTAATSLTTVANPWHLKLAVTLLDAQGVATQEGTVETWHAGAESRTVTTFGASSTTEVEHEGKHFYAAQGAPVPDIVSDVLDAVLHPGPEPHPPDGTKPELRK